MPRKDRLNDKFSADSARYAHLRELDAELPDTDWQIIIQYQPRVSPVQWQAVREFTIRTAVSMKPRGFETTRRLMTMSARFHAWVWATTGAELSVERHYTQQYVYRFLQATLSKHSETHRWGVVRQLTAIADALGAGTITQLPFPSMAGRRPFTFAEVAVMHSWAHTLTTTLKRQNACAILGLAGGAGLRTDELIETRVRDIDFIDGRVFVTVRGKRARRVPVTHPWNRTLIRSLENRTDPDAFLFRGFRFDEYKPRAIQTFLSDHPSKVRATVSRLRSTWIVTHIDNGLPVAALMAVAGFASAGSLDKHLRFAAPMDAADYTGLLIGEELAR